jgi:hypothetical protein
MLYLQLPSMRSYDLRKATEYVNIIGFAASAERWLPSKSQTNHWLPTAYYTSSFHSRLFLISKSITLFIEGKYSSLSKSAIGIQCVEFWEITAV